MSVEKFSYKETAETTAELNNREFKKKFCPIKVDGPFCAGCACVSFIGSKVHEFKDWKYVNGARTEKDVEYWVYPARCTCVYITGEIEYVGGDR